MNSNKTISLFGGTFNPPHWGHIKPLQAAMLALDIESVGLMPCNIPPHKQIPKISNEHRLAMLSELCKIEPRFYIEPMELLSTDVSYTFNTLDKIRQQTSHPLYFIMGTDSFQNLQSWYKWQDILQLCNLIVLNRDNQPLKRLREVTQYISCGPHDAVSLADKEVLATKTGIVVSCHFPTVDISSTIVRDKLQKRDCEAFDTGKLLPIEVLNYIRQHQLYEQN